MADLGGPRFIQDQLGPLHGSFFGSLGVIARPDGLWASFVRRDAGGVDAGQAYGVELDLQGRPTQPALPLDLPWGGGRVAQGTDRALVLYCYEQVAGWIFVDLHGNPTTDPRSIPGAAACTPQGLAWAKHGPTAAWSPEGDALIAWVDDGQSCEEQGSCVMVARADEAGLGPVRALHGAGYIGHGVSPSLASGPDAAIVVVLRWLDSFSRDVELVTTLVDSYGQLRARPVAQLLPQSSNDSDLQFRETHAVADGLGGFFVYVGGYGPLMGRAHVGGDGQVLESLRELPATGDADVSQVYNNFIGIAQGPDVHYAYGHIVLLGSVHAMVTALNRHGEPLGHLTRLGTDLAVAVDGTRTWVLNDYQGGALQASEIGCSRVE